MAVFLRTSTQKHVSSQLAWDKVTNVVCAVNNVVPNKHTKESTFPTMFGWDAYTLLVQMLNQKVRYLGNEKSFLTLDTLIDIYAQQFIVLNCLDINIMYLGDELIKCLLVVKAF